MSSNDVPKNPGDTVSFIFTFADQYGNPFNPASISCAILDPTGSVVANPTLTLVQTGTYSLTWNIPQTAAPGTWTVQINATAASGVTEVQSFYFTVTALEPTQLVPSETLIVLADVAGQLNATYNAGTYTVYGLALSEASFGSHVNFANLYVNGIAGSFADQTTMWLAALDIACIRILVTAAGGSLVGAYDYFLGDLRIARAGAYATALKEALQAYREDLSRQLVNLTPVAQKIHVRAAGEVPTYEGGLMSP